MSLCYKIKYSFSFFSLTLSLSLSFSLSLSPRQHGYAMTFRATAIYIEWRSDYSQSANGFTGQVTAL